MKVRGFKIKIEHFDSATILVASLGMLIQAVRSLQGYADTSVVGFAAIIIIILSRQQLEKRSKKSND